MSTFHQHSESKQMALNTGSKPFHNEISLLEDSKEKSFGRYPGSFQLESHENLPLLSRSKNDQTQDGSVTLSSSNQLPGKRSNISLLKLEEEMGNNVTQRLNQIIKARQNMKPSSFNNSETPKQVDHVVSPKVQKDMKMIKRISKFRDNMGIKQKTKEMRFEDGLKQFKNVKTFVKIQDVIKDLSESVHSLPASELKQLAMRGIEPATTRHHQSPMSFTERSLMDTGSANNIEDSSPFRKLSKLKTIGEDAIENDEMYELYQKLKANIIKQIGLEAFEMIEAELLKPKRQREIKKRTKMEIAKLRAMQKQLRNTDTFHSLIDHLNMQVLTKIPEEEDDFRASSLYQDIEKTLKQEDEKMKLGAVQLEDDEFGEAPVKGMKHQLKLRELLLKQEIERKEVLEKLYQLPEPIESLVELVDDERQLKVAGLLNEYKERSNKVIKLLKKKTVIMGKRSIKANKLQVEEIKAKLNQVLEPNEDSALSPARLQKKGSLGLPVLGRDRQSDKEPRYWKDRLSGGGGGLELSTTRSYPKDRMSETNSVKFQQNTLDNKKRFVKLSDDYHLGRTNFSAQIEGIGDLKSYEVHSPITDFTLSRNASDFSLGSLKRNRISLPFERSLDGIRGMLNDLSQSNREFISELECSKTEMKNYYKTKMHWLQKEAIPESLKLQFNQPENTKSKSALIMKITKKVLRDAYDG